MAPRRLLTCFKRSMATPVSGASLTPLRVSLQRPGERTPHPSFHLFSPSFGRAAPAGNEQVVGHGEAAQAPPAEVPLDELKRRAGIMFSGNTGAVVASGEFAVASAPSYRLVKDVVLLIEGMPDNLFDRHVEHRPCGLLCRYSAGGMLVGDVLGLPLLPWTLAEPIGKAAGKLKKEIPDEQKKAKKKAKRQGGDATVAATAVLDRRVSLPLPSHDAIKAETRRLARAARLPEPPPAPELPAAPEPPAEPVPPPMPPAPPMPPEGTPARARLDMWLSQEAAAVIIPAYAITSRTHPSRPASAGSLDEDEELEHAQVELKHALRRLKRAYPDVLKGCPWNEKSARNIIHQTVAIHSTGHIIPVAVASARRARFDLDRAAADFYRETAPDVPAEAARGRAETAVGCN